MSQTPIWSSLLNTSGSIKRPPSKSILLLGGDPTAQRDLINRIRQVPKPNAPRTLTPRFTSNSFDLKNLVTENDNIKIANSFGIGYTYHNYKDSETNDILSHLDIYTIPNEPEQGPQKYLEKTLKSKIFKDDSISTLSDDLVVIILLDWTKEPSQWIKILSLWIRFLKDVANSNIDNIMKLNKKLKRKFLKFQSSDLKIDDNLKDFDITFEDGIFNDPLGLNLIISVIGSDHITELEHEYAWKHEIFEYIQQILRTIALSHGGSILYIPKYVNPINDSLSHLISTLLSLPIASPNDTLIELKPRGASLTDLFTLPWWDTWDKILSLNPNFDIETYSKLWRELVNMSIIDNEPDLNLQNRNGMIVIGDTNDNDNKQVQLQSLSHSVFMVLQNLYQNKVPEAKQKSSQDKEAEESSIELSNSSADLEVLSFQKFLKDHYEAMEESIIKKDPSVSEKEESNKSYLMKEVSRLEYSSSTENSFTDESDIANARETFRRIREANTPMLTPNRRRSSGRPSTAAMSTPQKDIVSTFFQKLLLENQKFKDSPPPMDN